MLVAITALTSCCDLVLQARVVKLRVKVLEWLFSEAQDGKDVADRFIGTKKGWVKLWVNDAVTAEDLCKALSEMKSLPGEHKTFVMEPADANAEVPVPLKGGKGSKAKHFWYVSSNSVCVSPRDRCICRVECPRAVQFWPIHVLGT